MKRLSIVLGILIVGILGACEPKEQVCLDVQECETGFTWDAVDCDCEQDEVVEITCQDDEVKVEEECQKISDTCLENETYNSETKTCEKNEPNCVPGYEVKNGVCEKIVEVCKPTEVLIDGVCVDNTFEVCPPGTNLVGEFCLDDEQPAYNNLGYEPYAERTIASETCSHLDNIGQWQPVWCDEFDYEGLPNATRWFFETGGHGWGNGESQYYKSNDLDNSYVRDGNLFITAIKEDYSGSNYTSVRLNSKDGNWTYGKIQVRAILPSGKGTWPAVWMLPTDWEYGGWPDSGEIDIMEYVGYDPNRIHATVHTLAYHHSIGTQVGKSKVVSDPERYYHVYEIEWEPGIIVAYVDGIEYFTYEFTPEGNVGIDTFKAWPFDKDFHLILNIAIGGAWGGAMGIDDSIFPTTMIVDYVRVYQKDYEYMDNEAPEQIQQVQVYETKQNSLYLGWDIPSDDVMIEKYEIYVDGVLFETATVNGYLLKGLTPGTDYSIQIKAIDFAGNMSLSNTITASTSSPLTSLDRIEAEDYSNMSGIDTENTTDTGGGKNIGWVDTGDFTEYVVDVLESGTYTITFRVAGNGSNPGMNILSDGTLLVSTSVPATGGWQSWTDVTTLEFTLNEGVQTIRLDMLGSEFNINYFELNKIN